MFQLRGFLYWAILASQLAVAQSATVSGKITDSNGNPLAGAVISLQKVVIFAPYAPGPARYAPGEWPISVSATTDVEGGYKTSGLPAGNYGAHVVVPGQPYLDPPKWYAHVGVSVAAGANASLNVALHRGVFLKVRLQDPQHLLPTSEQNPLDFPKIIVGVKIGEGFEAASRIGSDATGQDYAVAVPANAPLNLWIHSRYVTFSDANGNALANTGVKVPFQASAGLDQAFVINITGRAAEQ